MTREQVTADRELPSFPATDKKDDPRFKWFVTNHGNDCWEIDAMDPNALRDCLEKAVVDLIEPVAWQRCEDINRAEQESLKGILANWQGCRTNGGAGRTSAPNTTPWWLRPRTTWLAGSRRGHPVISTSTTE